jgi:hypothetical protein
MAATLPYSDTGGLHLLVIDTGETHDVPLPQQLRANLWSVKWFPDSEKMTVMVPNEAGEPVIWVVSVFWGRTARSALALRLRFGFARWFGRGLHRRPWPRDLVGGKQWRESAQASA